MKFFSLFLLAFLISLLHVTQAGGNDKASHHKQGLTMKSGKVLLLADSKYFSHLAVAVQIANLMHGDGHQVDFVVADYKPKNKDLDVIPNKGIRVIRLPVDLTFEKMFLKSPAVFSNWTTEQTSSRQKPYWELMNYHTVSIYKAIIENPVVKIEKQGDRIFDWLRKQNYNFGIGQYGHFTSSFLVFHELGLKDTVAYSATPALPAFYHFIGVKIPPKVPEHYSAELGDG